MTLLLFLFFFFFFKQKTAYEIMPSLVGSEMCIRDRYKSSCQIHPKAANTVRGSADKTTNKSYRYGNACCCRKEVLYGHTQHLGKVTHRCFAAVGLPIGVCHE